MPPKKRVQLALYQPEIAQNTGTLLRTTACLDVHLHIIRPCSFPVSDGKLRRAAMDYLDHAQFTLHDHWEAFVKSMGEEQRQIILATPYAKSSFLETAFHPNHVILLGRESDGVPADIAAQCQDQCYIPMVPGLRSLNQAISGAMILTEALRQLGDFPEIPPTRCSSIKPIFHANEHQKASD